MNSVFNSASFIVTEKCNLACKYQEARDAVADAQWEKSYQLQLAAFELEKAAKSGSNSNYYGSGYYNPGSPEDDSMDVVDTTASKAKAANVAYEIEQMLASGYVGEDVKYYLAKLIKDGAPEMNDAQIQWLENTYGITDEELDYYTAEG